MATAGGASNVSAFYFRKKTVKSIMSVSPLSVKNFTEERCDAQGWDDFRRRIGRLLGKIRASARNLAFNAPKRRPRCDNLFFTGGSVKPGGGLPRGTLCGRNTAKTIQPSNPS